MNKRLRIHTALMYLNSCIAMFSIASASFVWIGVHYADWAISHMAIVCVYNVVIAIYSGIMACRYERSVEKLKAKQLKEGKRCA